MPLTGIKNTSKFHTCFAQVNLLQKRAVKHGELLESKYEEIET